MALEKRNRRKTPFVGSSDPRTYVASGFVYYVEQLVASSWIEVFNDTGWWPRIPKKSNG